MLIEKGHSTCTVLTQMTDDWFKEIDNKKIVGAVLLDFSAAFNIIDHNLFLRKLVNGWIQSYLSNRTQCFL
jgi:hypothetical protein